MTLGKIAQFTLHNALGESVLADKLEDWVDRQEPFRTFNGTSYSWMVDDATHEIQTLDNWKVLPDAAGFICFERGFAKDNCCLRDVYGELTKRLAVPWELTPYDISEDAKMWFGGLCDHVGGTYGVRAAIEGAGDWYFELDYHKGEFLWGKEIRF